MKRKMRIGLIIAFILTAVMSFTVFAADDHDSGWKKVSSKTDLGTLNGDFYRISPGNYYLDKDIESDYGFLVADGSVNICLHGNKLALTGSNSGSSYTIIVRDGAGLTLDSCGDAGAAGVENRRDSAAATVLYAAGGSTVKIAAGTIRSEKGAGIGIARSDVYLEGGNIEAEKEGVAMLYGTLTVKAGKISSKKNGIEITGFGGNPSLIRIVSGDISGLGSAIYVSTNDTGKITCNIEDGFLYGGTSGEECISITAPNHEISITGGLFGSRFPSGMNATVTGGMFVGDSVKQYVKAGYICRETGTNPFTHEVGERRPYTVVFTDGLGNTLKTENLTEGESASAPTSPKRDGYDFDGWDTDYEKITYSPTPVTVNAKWKKIESTSPSGEGKTEEGGTDSSAVTTGKTAEDGTDSSAVTTGKTEVKDLKKVAGVKLKSGKKRITVSWKKASGKVKKTFVNYEIQYGLKKNFSDAKTIRVKKTASKAILKGLQRKKTYYVRIRRIRDAGAVLHVSNWITKKVRVK